MATTETTPNANVIRFPAKPAVSDKNDIEIVHNGEVVIAMVCSLPLPEALRWAAGVLEGKVEGLELAEQQAHTARTQRFERVQALLAPYIPLSVERTRLIDQILDATVERSWERRVAEEWAESRRDVLATSGQVTAAQYDRLARAEAALYVSVK